MLTTHYLGGSCTRSLCRRPVLYCQANTLSSSHPHLYGRILKNVWSVSLIAVPVLSWTSGRLSLKMKMQGHTGYLRKKRDREIKEEVDCSKWATFLPYQAAIEHPLAYNTVYRIPGQTLL